MPTQVLRNAETTRATLVALCQKRTISFGPDDSDQSLMTSLLRFNACSSTAAGADMQWLAVHVRQRVFSRPTHMSAFEAAVEHPHGVGVDAASGPPTSTRPRYSPTVSLGRPAERLLTAAPRKAQRPPSRQPLASVPQPRQGMQDADASPPSHENLPPPSKEAAPPACASGHRSSVLQSAILVQSVIQENADMEGRLASSQQAAELQDSVGKVMTRLDGFAQSQAAANSRLDGAFVGVVNGQTAVMAAAAALTSAMGTAKRPSRAIDPPSKRRWAKAGRVTERPPASMRGENPASAVATATKDYHSPLVHDWSMPPEMLTAVFASQSLLMQLTAMVRMCHVSVDHPGLLGSYACLRMYEEGFVETDKVERDGGKSGTINNAKTEKMRNVVQNKADLWIRQIYWLHGVLPAVLNLPEHATYENMQAVKLSEADCTLLMKKIMDGADVAGWPASYAVRSRTKARVSSLRKLLSAMAARVKVESNVSVILSTHPFDELLDAATRNVREKYT